MTVRRDRKLLAGRGVRQRLLEGEQQQAEHTARGERSDGHGRSGALGAGHVVILAFWAGSRLLVLGTALVVQAVGWPWRHWHPGLLAHPFALLAVWDGRWYRMIATRGYFLLPGQQSDPAFFPLLPVVLHGLHAAGLSLDTAGVIVSNLAFLVGLLAFYELSRHYLPEADARNASVAAAVFPIAFVFSMVYSEALAFAALTLAGLFAVKERWLACALCAGLAALGRPHAVFVLLPIAAIAVGRWRTLSFPGRIGAITAILAGPIAIASFCMYLWLSIHDPLAWTTAEHAWGRSFALTGPYRAFTEIAGSPLREQAWLIRDAIFCSIYIACLAAAWRARLPRTWIIAGALIVIAPLMSGSFTSDTRFGLLALPVYWGIALLTRQHRRQLALRVGFPILLTAGTATIWLHWP